MRLRLAVCLAMAGARLWELAYSRRNMGISGAASEGRWSAATYPIVIVVHTTVISVTALRGSARPAKFALAILLLVQPLRAWVLLTLRSRWNTRGAVPRDAEVATRGPYAVVRHPNYAVVAVELAVLPLAFRLPRLALAGSAANTVLLVVRIRDEERALFALPGYAAHFGRKKRFIPGLF